MDLAQMVRDGDPDRYFAALFAPADKREALFALYAFDAEIASLRHKVREGMAGEIRLRWWADALAIPVSERSGNPLADALKETIERHNLPRAAFDTYLDARIADFYDDPFGTRADLEAYAGQTDGLIMQLACLILDREQAQLAADACGHGSCLAVLDRLLRNDLHPHALVPDDILASAGVDRAGAESSPSETLVSAIDAFAIDHAGAFRRAVAAVPNELSPAFLHLAPRLRPGARPGRLRRQWSVLKAATRGWSQPE